MAGKQAVAVLGANGFIGSRLVERLLLGDLASVRPIVRSFNGMVRSGRFNLACGIADATDREALKPHLRGCDVLFHCVAGDRHTILKSAEAAYQAAADAGVRRLVYLSSAVVHGNNPAPGTNEDSELVLNQPFEYNVSRVMAERLLRRMAAGGALELVMLRPLIVYGPRSSLWTARVATQLLNGTAYLVHGGTGVCNTVHVDNLVEALWLAAVSDRAANQAFIITDGERVTWRDLYAQVAEAVGADMSQVFEVDSARVQRLLTPSMADRCRSLVRQTGQAAKLNVPPIAKTVAKKILPAGLKTALKERWYAANEALEDGNATSDGTRRFPALDPFLVSVQDCQYMLPIDKARDLLAYEPRISFAQGCRKTGEWLRFVTGQV